MASALRELLADFPVSGQRQNCHPSGGAFVANGTTDGIVAGARLIMGGLVHAGVVTQPTATTWTATFPVALVLTANEPLVLIVTSADVDGPVELIIRFEHVPPAVLAVVAPGVDVVARSANSGTVRITGTVDNAATLVARVDGGAPTANLLKNFVAGFDLDDGPHTVVFEATGFNSTAPPSVSVTFNVDTIPPTVTTNTVTVFAPLQITGNVADSNGEVLTLKARLLSNSAAEFTVDFDKTAGATKGNFTFAPGLSVTGPDVVVFTATDNAGNASDFPILLTPPAPPVPPVPTVTFSGALLDNTISPDTVTLSGSVTVVNIVEFSVDGGATFTPALAIGGVFTLPPQALPASFTLQFLVRPLGAAASEVFNFSWV